MPKEAQAEREAMESLIEGLLEVLSGSRRRDRQDASHRLALIAHRDPSLLYGVTDALIDALYRPEAQTRWEVLDALTEVASEKADALEGAYDGAEASLFDEGSATVRLAAFRYLARYGCTSPERSDQVWGVLDEAIQCYHGDSDYRDMLTSLLDFAKGDVSDASRQALIARVKYDAESGRGFVRTLSEEIISIANEVGEDEAPAKKPARKKAAKKAEGED